MSSILENLFAQQIRQAGLPKPEREFVAVKGRRYRWDFAWPSEGLLVEINGAIWVKGAHSSGIGLERDYEKMAVAAIHGWHQMSFSGGQIKSGFALKMVQEFFENQRLCSGDRYANTPSIPGCV